MTKFEIQRNFANNIEKERYKLGMTQAEMAEALDMSLTKYKNMLRGTSVNISVYTAHLVHKLTGKLFFEMVDDDDEVLAPLIKYRDLPEHRKRALMTLINIEHDLHEELGEHDCEDYTTCYVALGNQKDGMLLNTVTLETVNISAYRRISPIPIDCAIRITSDHLHPAYEMGDILLVCQQPPRDGDVGIFVHKANKRLFIRRYRQTDPIRLEPITPYGKTIVIEGYSQKELSNWIKFGFVITKMR